MLNWKRTSKIARMQAFVTLLLFLTLVLSLTNGHSVGAAEPEVTSSSLPDTNFFGGDYRGFGARGHLHCRNACLEEERCKAWTYVRPGNQYQSGKCWLKDGKPLKHASDCCISGVKQTGPQVAKSPPTETQEVPSNPAFLDNTNLFGEDYRSLVTDGPLLCRTACEEEGRCQAWTYVRAGFQGTTGKCHLKDKGPVKQANDCCVSGFKDTAIEVAKKAPAETTPSNPGFLNNTNLFGEDYRSLVTGGPLLCRKACEEEGRCRAWTYVRPGIQGPAGKCWLKHRVPLKTVNDCCISGIRNTTKAAAKAEEKKPKPAPKDTGPHVFVSGLEGTFAKRVSADHRPLSPGRTFSENDRTIFIAFHNKGSRNVHATINAFTIDVEGFDRNTHYWRNAWMNLPPGQRVSLSFEGPKQGLIPGTYRFEIKAGGSTRSATVEVKSRHPYALRESEAEIGAGYNIALAALGGQVGRVSQYDDGGWSRRHINDGVTWMRVPNETDRCIVCGWSSREGDPRPSVVISFYENREAEIAAIVLDTRRFWNRSRNFEFNTSRFPKNVSIHVSSKSATEGFEHITTARLRRNPERQIIPLPEGTVGRFVKVQLLENFGARNTILGEIEVIEANSRERSILEDAEFDLANVALGGALVRYSGYDDQSAANLFDADDTGTRWRSYDRYFPQDFTIAFKDDHEAMVDKVRLTLSPKDKPATWPSELAISVSRQSPLDGFVEIGRFAVEKRAGPQEFAVGREARFVKVRVLDNHGGQRTSLGEIAVIEGRQDDYVPVVLRGERKNVAEETNTPDQDRFVADDAVLEAEPNNDIASAGDLVMGQTLQGTIDPLGETDFLAVPKFDLEVTALTLNYSGHPYIRHDLSLLKTDGSVISHFDPGDLPATDARLTFALTGDERYLKLTEPAASVVVIWDTSGSMNGSERDLERAVREYIRRAPENQKINMIRFSDDVEVLSRTFTSDKQSLERALRRKFHPKGGTRFYDAVLKGIELLAETSGNRAMVVMTDGEDNGRTWHGKFWREIENNRVRLYTIGLGQGLENYSYAFATSGKRILRHLALGTNGEAFFAAESDALKGFYQRIADELSRPATYLLTPTVERGTGTLRLIATGEQVPSAAMPAVHLIYDLSGSMLERGPDGRPKYRTAQKAVFTAVDALPDGTLFGLTVYGARIPERAGKDKACTDIVTLQNLAPINKRAVKDFIAGHKPRGGTTPLAGSVRHVAENFPAKTNGLIIAVTDGIEECDPNAVETIKGLKTDKMQYLPLNVVGFALKDPEAHAVMKKISEVGGGQYFDASDGEALAQALKETMAAKYTVRDAADRVVGSGTIDGGDTNIPAGFYRVQIDASGAPIQVRDIRIDHDHVTTVRVNKVGSEVDVVASEPESLAALREARQSCGATADTFGDAQRAARIQAKLNQLGFNAGPADNRPGRKTRRAIAAFAKKYGLPEDLPIDLLLEQHLDCVIAVGNTYLDSS